jgi:3-hydroxyisobutyrate dehydrogenase-like beta-hydroxyacid dehydrogenase
MNVGFIGLGNLGTAIADNLLTTQQLYVFNRTVAKTRPLIDKGAILCRSVKELSEKCEVIFTIVSNDEAVKEITEGAHGVAANLRPGGIHVSLSTILPATSIALQQLHQQNGSHYLACPVMARPDVARARKINFLISGDPQSICRVKSLIEQAGAAKVWNFGVDAGAANVAKLASNYLVIAAMEALAEALIWLIGARSILIFGCKCLLRLILVPRIYQLQQTNPGGDL